MGHTLIFGETWKRKMINLRNKLVESELRRRLDYGLMDALKYLLENNIEEGLTQRISQRANAYAQQAGKSLYFTHRNAFGGIGEAQAHATAYFNTHWAGAFNNALDKNRYFKTPNGGIVYIPDGEVSHYNEDGAVYAIRVNSTEYFWDFREELYFDINQNIYDPHGELGLGEKPRYIKTAYKKFLEVKMGHPDAYMSIIGANNIPEANINHFDVESGIIMGFGGASYDGRSFNEKNFPEPSGVGAYTPFVAPIWSGINDYEDGDFLGAAMYTGITVSDAFMIRSIGRGIMKGGLKAMTMGNNPWSHSEFYDPTKSYGAMYHSSGFAEKGIHIHHSFLKQNLGIGKSTPNFFKHQMFGLKPIKNRLIGGKSYYSRDIHNAIHQKSRIL